MRGSFSLRLTPSSVEVATEKNALPGYRKMLGLVSASNRTESY